MQKKKWLSRSLLMTEQRLWTGTEPLARSVCLGLKVSSKLNWVAGTHPSFLFVSPAPVYFHYQYQIVIAGPCESSWRGISLRGIASQRDPISPHPWSPPRIEWPSPGCRAPRWSPSCPASLEVSDSRWQSAQQRLILSFFSVGGWTVSPESIWCSSVRSIELSLSAASPRHPRCGCPSVREEDETKTETQTDVGGRRCSARSILIENMKKSDL